MKTKYMILSLVLAFSSVSRADWWQTAIDYGLPCLVGIGLGAGLGDTNKDKTAIGASVCGAVSMSTFLNQRREKVDVMDEDFKKFVKLMNERVDQKTLEMEAKQTKDLAELKELMKQVIAERMIQWESNTKSDIEKYLKDAEFMKSVEAKLTKEVKESVLTESKLNKKEIVDKCINEALEQLVKKRYGTTKEEILEEK
jgi:hypothetical protein